MMHAKEFLNSRYNHVSPL